MKHLLFLLFAMCVSVGIHAADEHDHESDAAPALPGSDAILTMEQVISAFWPDITQVEVTTEKVTDGLYVLFGAGGNIGVSVGDDGVLIVDDMFESIADKVLAAIEEVGGDGIDFVVNTHGHFDHADGNKAFGPMGSLIVAHSEAAKMMQEDFVLNMVNARMVQTAYPERAQPTISFDTSMSINFNGTIDLIHVGPAHTSGDAVVIFRDDNAVHFGDVFLTSGYPFIDVDSGGSVNGMIAFCESVLSELNDDTTVIPGHGPITNVDALRDWIVMLTAVRDNVQVLIDEGKSLEEIEAANVTAEFDTETRTVENSLGFVNRVYTSLMQSQ